MNDLTISDVGSDCNTRPTDIGVAKDSGGLTLEEVEALLENPFACYKLTDAPALLVMAPTLLKQLAKVMRSEQRLVAFIKHNLPEKVDQMIAELHKDT